MGYTHYWTFLKQPNVALYKLALDECKKIVTAVSKYSVPDFDIALGGWDGDGYPNTDGEVGLMGVVKSTVRHFIFLKK